MRILKISVSISLLIILLILVSACRNNGSGSSDLDNNKDIGVTGTFDDFDIEKHIYLPHEIDMADLEGLWDPVGGAITHGDSIVCWYHDYADIIVLELTPDGNTRSETRLPGLDSLYSVNGLFLTDDDLYAVVAATSGADDEVSLVYIVYDDRGTEISKQKLFDIPGYFSSFTRLEYVIVTDNNIVVVTESNNNQTLHLLTTGGEKLGELSASRVKGITQLRDGRIVALFNEGASSSLREIDFNTGSWGGTHNLAISNAGQLIPAAAALPYDFFVDAGGYLIGYVLETDKQTPLINWLESGIAVSPQHHIGMLPNNDVFALHSGYMPFAGSSGVFINLAVFARSLRADIDQQRTIITIGGLYFSPELRTEIANFNRESKDYQIEIVDYYSEDLGSDASRLRFNVDLIAGKGPDILVESNFGENTVFLADLYTFIDADPELDRIDFFPNVLRALERPAGTLPFIANNFTIITMIAKRETAELLTPFTFNTILQNLDESDPYALAGDFLIGIHLVGNAVSNSEGFIDWDNRQANFINDEFINLLEIAARLPEDYSSTFRNMEDDYKNLREGKQLLLPYYLNRTNDFRVTKAQIGDIVTVGVPTFLGGQNIVHVMGDIGIYARSPNQDAAWSFIRRLLLPDANVENTLTAGSTLLGFPLRIDKFEKQIAESMVKKYWEHDFPMLGGVAGEEEPQFHVGSEGLLGIPIYAMTEDEAHELRAIINSATVGTRSDMTVWAIIEDEFKAFTNGVRSSADTARIIQNRVQTYLSEQG